MSIQDHGFTHTNEVPLSMRPTALLDGTPGTALLKGTDLPLTVIPSTRNVHRLGSEGGKVGIGSVLATPAYRGSYSPITTISVAPSLARSEGTYR